MPSQGTYKVDGDLRNAVLMAAFLSEDQSPTLCQRVPTVRAQQRVSVRTCPTAQRSIPQPLHSPLPRGPALARRPSQAGDGRCGGLDG